MMKVLSKTLEALGIACVMIGLIDGVQGSMWLELYLLIIGLLVFLAGWGIDRLILKKQPARKSP
jgi:hypothetical protein